MASLNNVAEMALGQLAADSSQTPAIKEFGQMMVNDHANAQGGLVALASQYGVTPHDTPDQEHIALLQKLLTLKGREFDSLYIHSQVADHYEAVTLFQTAYDLGNNRELGTYITSTLPSLQQHLQHAQALAQVVFLRADRLMRLCDAIGTVLLKGLQRAEVGRRFEQQLRQ